MKNAIFAGVLALFACSRVEVDPQAPQPSTQKKTELAQTNVEKPATPAPKSDVDHVVDASNAFGADLLKRISHAGSNVVFSPSSISTALAMTYAGARGDTAKEMRDTLRFDLVGDALHDANQTLLSSWEADDPKGVQIHVANRLFGQNSFAFEPAFVALTHDRYGAGLERLDFFGDSEGSRKVINDWVAAQTKDKIQNLVPSGMLSPDTRLVLVNAMHFKGGWREPFDASMTKDDAFTKADGTTTQVPTMHATLHHARYAETTDGVLVDLPFASTNGAQYSMTVVVPKDGKTIDDLVAKSGELRAWAESAKPGGAIDLSLPKFQTTFAVDLKGALQSMGMKRAFDLSSADFSGISKDSLSISHIAHKAFVDVNETGVEAAAATAVVIDGEAAVLEKETHVVKADRPFLMAIRDDRTGATLFLGAIGAPKG